MVAERDETAAQGHALSTVHHCDYMQGYLYSPPLPVQEFEHFAEQCSASALATWRDKRSSIAERHELPLGRLPELQPATTHKHHKR